MEAQQSNMTLAEFDGLKERTEISRLLDETFCPARIYVRLLFRQAKTFRAALMSTTSMTRAGH